MADSAIIDPRDRRIWLSDATWHGHIVKGHPDVALHRVLVESALKTPITIRFSTSDTDCRLYYGPPQHTGLMMCVVADVVGGFVKTAYWCKRIKPGAIE